MKRIKVLFGIILIHSLVGCNIDASNRVASNSAHSKKQIVIALGWGDSPTGFDPTLGWGYHDPPLFQSTLVRRDENLKLVNDLAKSYTLSPDKKIWRFKIRPDVRFSDGQALTAADVAYTFNQAKASPGLTDVTNLDKAVATSVDEVELHLKKPQITFINRIAQLGIVPKHRHNQNYGRNPIGSGPYRLVQWDEGQQMIVEANPDYYGEQPEIKRIVFLFTKGDAVFSAAKARELDLAQITPFLAKQSVTGMDMYVMNSNSRLGLMFPYVPNTGRKTAEGNPIGNNVTADRAIRQAVNYAINRQALVTGILEGYGSPAYGAASQLPWDQPKAAIADGNPDKAKQILAAGGWRDSNGDGVVEKAGMNAEFTILYPVSNPTSQGLGLAIAQMLKPIGIKVSVEGKSWEDISRRMHQDVGLFPWGTYDPQDLYILYHSSAAQGDWRNSGYYSNPQVDQALDKAMAAASETAALPFWQQAQWNGQTGTITIGDAASAWLLNLDQIYLVSSCLDIGRPTQNSDRYTGSIMVNITKWRWVCN